MTYNYNVNNSNLDFDVNGGTHPYILEIYGHSTSQFYDSSHVVPHTFQNLPCDVYSFIIHDNNNCTHPDNNNVMITIPVPFINTISNNSPTLTSDVQGATYQMARLQ